ncbi:2-hydroxymuconate tautomerase family protein [Herbaspirillum lusitanum]|jgi:4-oxalocrotonate tautomerase|uniref:Tautomerase n=2 Tax=Herbaspirillum lusitanum TaxID=213312 RepID=A0ABW9AFQ6_9BURK
MSIIQVFFIAGRTDEQKERLIAGLTEAAVSTLGMDRAEVRVIIKDVPNTEYGIAGQTAKSLGRGVGRSPQGN